MAKRKKPSKARKAPVRKRKASVQSGAMMMAAAAGPVTLEEARVLAGVSRLDRKSVV